MWGYGGDFWENDAPAIDSEASVQAVEWLWDAVNDSEIIPPFAAAADATYDALVLDTLLNGDVGQSTGFGSYWITRMEEEGLTEGCFPATAECVATGVTPMVSPNPGGAPIRGHRRGAAFPRTNGRLSEPAYNGAVSRKD